jgi:hypothetical protein
LVIESPCLPFRTLCAQTCARTLGGRLAGLRQPTASRPDCSRRRRREKFFARLIAGQSAARALAETQRELAAHPNPRIRHPSSWAGFVLVGAG